MADLLQRLTRLLPLPFLVLPGLSAGADRPFSHKLHLKMKLACLKCHPTVTASTRIEDNNLPDGKVCATCHEDMKVSWRPAQFRIRRFDHSRHLNLGNVAPVIAAAIDSGAYLSPSAGIRKYLDTASPCGACHRGLEDSDEVSRAALPQMADCLVCHNKIDLPFSCEFCHNPGPELKPANHTPGFVDAHTSGKMSLDKTTCAVCHGRKFRCMGCH